MHMNRLSLQIGMLAVLLTVALAGCQTSTPGSSSNTIQAESALAMDAADVKRLGLRSYWSDSLKLPDNDRVIQVTLLAGDQFVATTKRNFCYLIDAATGEWRVMTQFAPETAGNFQPPTFDGVRFFFAGTDRIAGVNKSNDKLDIQIKLEMPSKTRAVSDREFIYTGSLDGKIFAYSVETQVKHWESKVGPAVTNLALAKENLVITRSDVLTGHGSVSMLHPKLWNEEWQKPTEGAITAPITVTPPKDEAIFVACQDGSVFRFNVQHGWDEWRYRTPAALVDGPLVLPEHVIQLVPGAGGGTFVISRIKGTLNWKDDDRLTYLAMSKDKTRMYFYGNGNLIAKDPASGKDLLKVPVAGSGIIPVPNPDGTRLYLFDSAGGMLCLNDLALPYLMITPK